MSQKSLDTHIEIVPGVMGGKPHIAGHRISVEDIMVWHERLGHSADEIPTEYNLSLSDVYAALPYYYDNKEAIDNQIKEGEAFLEALRQKTPSKLTEKLNVLKD